MSASSSLLASLPPVQQLQAGCVHLGLPPHAAVELVRFLTLKRLISLRSGSSKVLGVSPGYQLDRLWHWMLLNTQVARGVHALVGGEVDHATPDAAPLGDNIKMMRRLLALNLMGREGWAPDLELWKEPGTVMAAIVQVTLPGDTNPLYVSGMISRQQQQLLQADLQAATQGPAVAAAEAAAAAAAAAGQTGPAAAAQQAGRRRSVVAPTAHRAAAPAAAAPPRAAAAAPRLRKAAAASATSSVAPAQEGPARATRGARKRARHGAVEAADASDVLLPPQPPLPPPQQQQQQELDHHHHQQQQQQQQKLQLRQRLQELGQQLQELRRQQQQQQAPVANAQPKTLTLVFQDQNQAQMHFKVKPTTRFHKFMKVYADLKQLDVTSLLFLYDGERLNPYQCPEDLCLEDGDVVDVLRELIGC